MAYWLDEGFDSWPQVVRAGTAAAGLYVRCGAWISRGFANGTLALPVVPPETAAMYGTPEWISKLVGVGLWRTDGSGYEDVFFHVAPDGTKLNRTAADWVKERTQRAARNARYHAKKTAAGKTPRRRVLRRSEDESQDASQDGAPSLSPTGKGARSTRIPGHLPSCPLTHTDPRTCSACSSERKGAA